MLGVPVFLGTAGACIFVVVVILATRRAAVVLSLAFDRINEPGSPDKGVSSINSSPYRERRFMASIRFRVCWNDVSLPFEVVLVAVKEVFAELWESGTGVSSLLCWDDCEVVVVVVWGASTALGPGGM
jgi:hypothetical protein